jgi:hypothetical protein
MKIVEQIYNAEDEVSGAWIFDDGTKVWFNSDGTDMAFDLPSGVVLVDMARPVNLQHLPLVPYMQEVLDANEKGSDTPDRAMSSAEMDRCEVALYD